jgi:hypothetical protein
MHRYRSFSILMIAVMVMTGIMVSPARQAAHARQTNLPVVFLKDGDIWTYDVATNSLIQQSTWGYNERPVLSPNGTQVAYNSWATITVNAIAAGHPVLGPIPSNIWVMDTQTGSAFRAADQPADATYFVEGVDNNIIDRGTPAWSPDGSQLAWVELVMPGYTFRIVIFDMGTRTQRVLTENVPFPYGDAGVIPVHEATWSTAGIALVNSAVNHTSNDFEDRLYVYDPVTGGLLSDTLIGSSATEFPFNQQWVGYNNQEFFGVTYPSGKRYLVDPRAGTLHDMPALPELYTPFMPTGATAFSAVSIDPNQNQTRTWTAVYPNRQQDQMLAFTGESKHISIAPDGQRLAYFASDGLYIWQNGQVTLVPGTQGDYSPWDISVVWSPNRWRVRTDWPGIGGGVTICTPAPRLTVGGSGQVTPGLPNVIRSLPRRGSDSPILGEIPGGGVFAILNGPTCGPEGRNWWQVNYQGIVGWTAEGEASTYWLQPFQTTPAPVACTLTPRLTVGATGYVLPGLPNVIRSEPRRGSDSVVIGRIPGSGMFIVLAGPVCGPEGRNWWQVNYQGVIGWTAEGEAGTYWTAPITCTSSPPPRLLPGMQAVVTPGDPNRLRLGPGTNYDTVSQVPAGGVVTVLSGPQCGPEGWTYWRVQYGSQIGWTAEGSGQTYWLEPLGITPPTPPAPVACTLAPRMTIGGMGHVLPGLPNIIRSEPGRTATSAVLGQIPGDGLFSVLAGPTCGPEGRYWWQVSYQGIVGWTPEGEGSTYWIEPHTGSGPGVTCLPPSLTIGATGYVIPGPSNVLRSQPYRHGDSQVIGQIPGGGWFRVLSGPQCDSEGIQWWYVNYNGILGWTGESMITDYWTASFSCGAPLITRLMPGGLGRVLPGDPNALRSAPGTGSGSSVIGQIPGGGTFTILAGPQCADDGRIWWQVQYGSLIGWTAEGENSTYWLEPVLN